MKPSEPKRSICSEIDDQEALQVEAALRTAIQQQGPATRYADRQPTADPSRRGSFQRATRCGYFWAVGCAHLFHGWDLLHNESPTADPAARGRRAPAELQRAFTVFHHDADQFLALSALDTTALALALRCRQASVAGPRGGAHRHAKLLGICSDHFRWVDAMIVDRPPLDPADELGPGPAALSWSGMVGLVNATVRVPAGER